MRTFLNRKILIFLLLLSFDNYAQSESFEELKSLELMDQIYEHLDMYFVDEVAHGKLSKTAIDAMLKELDPYTVYYHEANIEDYRLMTTGQYGGIGALIGTMDNEIYITDPYEGNPAQKAGLQAGDKILRIDKKSVVGKTVEEASNALKGPKGTQVSLEVERNGKTMIVDVIRDEIKIPDIPYAGMLSEKTGYVSLSSFTQTAGEEVKKNILDLQSKGMTKMILDLRGNGGGLLMEAVKIVGFFVPKGQVVVTTKGRSKQENMVYKTLEAPIAEKLPLVILIDEGSASASEIVAGALQDLDRAVVVGNTSYGKGLVQRTFDLKYGSKMKLTIAKYYTPSGRCVQRLEYYDDANGGKPTEIADSLLQKFSTKNGREVIDGRGIEPDIKIEDSVYSDYTRSLMNKHYIFHFATMFHNAHPSIASAESFELSSNEIEEFRTYLKTKGFVYTSPELRALERIKLELEKKQQFQSVSSEFNALNDKLTNATSTYFDLNKSEIKGLLEHEIIGRYYFQKGQNIYAFKSDEVVTKSVEILSNDMLYKSTLHIK
jgi:carboxyl-terminal processing protease